MQRPFDTESEELPLSGSMFGRLAAGGCAAVLFAALAAAVLLLPEPQSSLPRLVREALPSSGVQNPVTAVLLNFRGYDTLLEVAVLLVAAAAAGGTAAASAAQTPFRPADTFLAAFFRFAAPLMVLVSGYVLWVGKHAPGGAFQAGSILAAAGVLAILADRVPFFTGARRCSLVLVLGLLTFIAVGLGAMGGGGNFLQYPPHRAGALILLIESAAALSIAMALVALFTGCLWGASSGEPASGPGAQPEPPGRFK
jgi:multisubunit Na+/H+ antiporter MnhB subunit